MSEPSSKTSAYDSPFRLLVIIAASVFVAEALIMVLLMLLPPLPHFAAALLDAALVTVMVYPILYRFMLHPMTQHLDQRKEAESALRRAHDELEARVSERTAELAQANESLQVQIVERQHASEELKAALDLVQQRQAEMAGLLTGARAVLEYRDFTEVARAIFEACRSTIGAAAGYVGLPVEDRSSETPVFSNLGEWANNLARAIPMPMVGMRLQAYATSKTVYTNECDDSERVQWLPGGHLRLTNVLLAPMKIKGFVVGVLGLANKSGGFSDDDARLATAFAELAAIAMLNSQTIELLESSERRFRTLAQATFEGIIISEGGIIREANEQFAQIYGYRLSDVVGRPVADFLTLQPHEQVLQTDTSNESHIGEYRAFRRDGSIVLLGARGRTIERGGQAMHVIAIRDITARKQAEEALRQSEENFSKAFRSSPAALLITRLADGQYLELNDTYCAIVGYDRAELLGHQTTEFYIFTEAGDRQAIVDRLLASGSIRDLEISIRHRSGAIRHVVVAMELITFNGEACVLSSLLDITERTQAEEALRESEARFRVMFEGHGAAMLLIAPGSGQIIDANEAAARFYGYSREQLLAMRIDQINQLPPEEVASERHKAVDRTRNVFVFPHRLASGDVRLVEVYASPVTIQGQPMLFSIIHDITERKRAEEALRQSRIDLDRAQEVGQIGSWRLDVRRNVLTWSNENHRIFGVPQGTPMTYDTFLTSVHPDDRAYVDRQWAAALTGEPYDIEHRIIAAGVVKWVREKAYLEFDQDGALLGGFGITQDITERKRVENQLRATLESIGDSFIAVDADWRFVYVNNPAELSMNIRRDELLGRSFWDVFPLTVGTNLEREYRRAASGEIRDFENYYEPWSRWFHNRCFPREGGGMSVYFEDITARKQTEDRVTWLASFPELNPSPVVEVDLAGNIHYLNPAAKRVLPGLETEGCAHPWLADLAVLGQTLQEDDASVVTREIGVGNAVYQQTMCYVPNIQRVRIYALDITARKQAEEQLRLLSTALEATVNGVVVTDLQGQIRWVNPAFTDLTGYSREEALGQNPRVLKSGQHGAEFYQELWDKILSGQPWSGEIVNRRKDGAPYYEEMTITPVRAGGDDITHFVAIKEDITARKRREAELQRLNRTLKALGRSSQAMLHAQGEGDYLADVCRIIVEDCGYRMVWIGMVENDPAKMVRPVAYAGFEAGYLESLKITWADTERGRGPTGTAIRTGQVSRCRNMLTDPNFAPWRENALKQGYASSIVFPLMADDRAFGSVAIYSSEPDAFEDSEVELLGDLTNDLAYGITALRTRAAHAQAEVALRHAHNELERRVLERTAELAKANNELRLQSAALQAAANGIIITDGQGKIQWANSALTEMTGYAAEEVLGQSPRLFKSGLREPEFYQHLWESILSGQVWRGELINRRKNGSLYVEEQTISPVWDERGEIANFVAVKQDVTEREEARARLEQNNRDLQMLSSAERRARQIAETLSAANLALTQSLDLEAVMTTLLDYVYQLVPYDSANVMLLESEERLVIRAMRGYEQWTDTQLTRAISFDAHSHRMFHELLTLQHSVLIPETAAYAEWEARPGAEHVRSWVGVPIVAGGHVIGVYSLDKVIPNFFTTEHVRLAEALVGQAAVAIQNAWLFDQLRAGRERLQSLSRRLVEVQEAERHYVARELHDEAGQALTSLVYGLGELERETNPDRRILRLTELKKMTHEVLESLHRLAMDLRPASLDFSGLVPALQQYVTATGERHGLNAQFKALDLTEERLPAVVETALYRIVQEALTNVIRHARATRIDVLLERRDEYLVLVVEDNGRGFEADLAHQAQAGHLGLIGMQERAEMLGGTLVIESNPGSGTTIVVEVPYAH